MISKIRTLAAPFRSPIVGSLLLGEAWERYFLELMNLLSPLGFELNYDLLNNQSTAIDLKDLQLDKNRTTFVSMDYVIKRARADGASSQALIETGILHAYYNPGSETWGIRKISNGPDNTGVTLSITNEGQIRYASTNLAGEMRLFKLTVLTLSL